MAGSTIQAKIENRTQRRRLPAGRAAHFRTLIPGRAHLGYQRKEGATEGRWIIRRFNGSAYSVEALGVADDVREPDGERVLDFEQAHRKALAAVDAAAGKPRGRITVRQAFINYVAFLQSSGKQTQLTEQRGVAYILPKLGDIEVASITSEKIRQWFAAMASAPALVRTKKGERQQFKAPPGNDPEAIRRRRSSANRVLTMLKAALNHAFDEKHVTSNTEWGRRVKPFKGVDVARVRYLSIVEAKRLINACALDFRPLVIAALETGCRYGELTRLEVQDFNPDAGTVGIRRSKSSKARHVVLTDQGAAFFRQACAGRAGADLMFRRADGDPWKASQQKRPMFEACGRAQITPLGIHQLRHTWASHAVMNGVPLIIVAKNLGHKDTRMVEKHYGHLAPTYIVDAIRAGAPKFGFKPDKKIAALR